MNTSELTELMNDRMLAYRFLERAYRAAPDRAFLNALGEASGNRPAGDSLQEFFAEFADADAEALRIDLAADYNRLFLGMSAHPVPPYESVYTSSEGLLMQDARDQVVSAYGAEGLCAPEGFDLPEDHLAIECSFMAELAFRTKVAIENGNGDEAERPINAQRSFAENHLASWVPAFCDDVQEKARTSFFRGLAAMTRTQIEADKLLLASL